MRNHPQINFSNNQSDSPPAKTIFKPMSEESMKFMADVGRGIIENKIEKLGIGDYLSLKFLKCYFQIDNQYVFNKIKWIFFPFLYKDSNTFEGTDNIINSNEHKEGDPNQINKDKIEYPDLYIPLMSFITFLLLVGVSFGQDEKFHPELLVIKATKNFFIVVFHAFIVQAAIYICFNTNFSFFQYLSYVSYKFVLLVVIQIVWIFTNNYSIYYGLLATFCLLSIYYMNLVLKYRLLKNGEENLSNQQALIIRLITVIDILSILLLMY